MNIRDKHETKLPMEQELLTLPEHLISSPVFLLKHMHIIKL